ncbi:hypothetical protein KMW28_22035 [Flammeovirga yaeyamensis]|uniref:Outer membrane protein beta-barrel domain-containing protein n=1 Tax=Flammeovirga yaeyamensis TaxID=367791 RepID=A0AAX1NEZ6_9BACT|nr:hypothetical protein [Flammeovirga yaeyamensis]MBB3696963.1 hypothetical protein [Flammeovirga yaeyamensis]NMF33626.1 hypothetical protein [Flammeovirga yaeyamensis]QWG05107.1 hypothetical protein KMW28_22035 [Flammeovirga yaeyamensis]
MKKILFLLAFFTLSIVGFSQDVEKVKQKEIGLTYTGDSSFGMTFRIGNNKSLWRFSSVIGSSSSSKTENDSTLLDDGKYSFYGFRVGKEFRKSITKKLDLRYGLDLGFTYQYSLVDSYGDRHTTTKGNTYTPSVGVVFGFNYYIVEDIILGLEMIPTFSKRFQDNNQVSRIIGDNNEILSTSEINHKKTENDFSLSNQNITLSLVYKF